MTLSVILFCIAGSALLAALYALRYGLLVVDAWLFRKEPPRERFGFLICVMLVVGAMLGGMVHNPVQAMLACKAGGQDAAACLLGSDR